ncbi:succinate dehydrogenase [Clostridiales bacterium PH28_bin88]|nr:succinate dehydrogenase [Clostridiales bacterium PH28_bin88]
MSEKLVVVGGGLAGLMATLKAAEAGVKVDLLALGHCKRSHSACAQGGINAALNTRGEGDSPWEHFDDTIYGGDFLANQTPVKGMCEAAPGIIHLFDRMGMMFNRTPEGLIDLRQLGGVKHHRVAFSGSTTGQQLLYALDEQVRRMEVAGLVTRYEGWEFLSAIIDDNGICRGITAQDLKSMEIRSFPAEAVIIATGGPGMIFGRTTNSIINTGFAASVLYQQGVKYANGEFIQIHPTAIPGADKNRLISESVRGEGGRVWTYKDGKPWYFLEEWYPAYGNLVPRDVATRAIFKVCVEMGLGIDGQNMVYLDMSHMDPREIERRLEGIIDIYQLFTSQDPRKVPMKIFPAVHYSMGGLWVDFDQMTNIPGLFAAGECEYQYHGANRLGGNGMLSAIYGGMVAGPKAVKYLKNLKKGTDATPGSLFEAEVRRQEELEEDIRRMDGKENAYLLHEELGSWMNDNVTVVRYNDRLQKTLDKIAELKERYRRINIQDTSRWSNQAISFTRQLWGMLELAQVITLGALTRDESRGAHYKPEFPDRDDANWLKTTIATYTPESPVLTYEPVDLQYVKPRVRKYDVDKEVTMVV